MSLVKCHECGNQISTEAKTCPQCGAKNKARAKTSKWLIVIATIILIYGWYIYSESKYGYLLEDPTCANRHATKLFKQTFDGSPYAQKNKLRVIEVSDQKEVSSGSRPEDRVCEITFRLNDSDKVTYIFTFESTEDGNLFVKGSPK